ncbi:hypothetical protein CAEBREN_22773 [Caenorhabditis brenneri]|uniref:Zer-1-like leucine-rich repeats region domain-containing protein n=1 Tax=Caenorhabditis brenneri TaxID=135651 RepID=G0MD83_CAEBE|nr:hypothetical protein CAEBREN_22773 [Caenorhabditis brenneri]
MVAVKLKDLAMDKVVDLLIAEQIRLPSITPDNSEFSNLLYKSLRQKTILTPFLLEEFQKLTITQVELMSCMFDAMDILLLKTQPVRKLAVNDIDQTTGGGKYFDERKQTIDMYTLLGDTLRNCHRLTHLDLRGVQHQWLVDWMRKIGENLLNMQYLAVTHQNLRASDVFLLVRRFPNLTYLDISCSSVESLRGIAELHRLKTLILFNTPLPKRTEFYQREQSFKLYQLEHLDLSVSSHEQNMSNIIGAILPSLVSLDCYNTKFSERQLVKVLGQHRFLKKMGLLGTDAINHPIVDLLEKMTIPTVSTGLTLLEQFIEERRPYVVFLVELRMISIIEEKFVEQDKDELRGLVKLACKVFKTFNYEHCTQFAALQCLDILTKDNRVSILLKREKAMIVNTLFPCHPKYQPTFTAIKWRILNQLNENVNV